MIGGYIGLAIGEPLGVSEIPSGPGGPPPTKITRKLGGKRRNPEWDDPDQVERLWNEILELQAKNEAERVAARVAAELDDEEILMLLA